MACCPHCEGADVLFDLDKAKEDLEHYLKTGPSVNARFVTDTLKKAGVEGLSLLDIGGGVGALQHELAAAGVAKITDVDASRAYLQMAREEAERRGYGASASYVHGDFVAVGPTLEPADIVTLDRVICCYPDVNALVDLAASKARRFFALVYPRDHLLIRVGLPFENIMLAFQRTAFRVYIHRSQTVERLISAHGLKKIAQRRGWLWQAAVYAR